MSIRNLDADMASNKLNELFHLHRYDDCVLFINRLNHTTIKLVVAQISLDMYLSRLPYTIEILEALYAKLFIIDPDNFPIRFMQPERLIDKMVVYFSMLNDQNKIEPIDGAKLLDSFENVIRIISYVQPNAYSRLLYFKYVIDKSLLRFEKDSASYTKNSIEPSACMLDENDSFFLTRLESIDTCEKLKSELTEAISNCEKTLIKLNDYINNLKSEKYLKNHELYATMKNTYSSLKRNKKVSSSPHNNNTNTNKKSNKKQADSSASHSKRSESHSVSRNGKSIKNLDYDSKEFKNDSLPKNASISTICQELIRNRLYFNKSVMNLVEPNLEKVKLQQLLAKINDKINFDKEILLVYTHLKREEKYISSMEPLEPLFKRYSLGFERCIQIWRKKGSADSLLLMNDKLNDETNYFNSSCLSQFEKLYIVENDESNELDRMQSSYISSLNTATGIGLNSSFVNQSYSTPFATSIKEPLFNNNSSSKLDLQSDSNRQSNKCYSELNLNSNPILNIYCTLPHKNKTQRKSVLYDSVFNQDSFKRPSTRILSKHAQSQTSLEKADDHSSTTTLKEKTIPSTKESNENELANHINESSTNNSDEDKQNKSKLKDEIENLSQQLSSCKQTIEKLRKNENKLREKLSEKEEIVETLQNQEALLEARNDLAENYIFASDLIALYENLNNIYRIQAFDSLAYIKEIKDMQEFKIKLLFSVIVLSYRYVKLYIRDLKRKVKGILQINERGISNERGTSQKSQSMTPTIVIQTADSFSASKRNLKDKFFNDSLYETKSYKSTDSTSKADSSLLMIEQALNKYLQAISIENSYYLNKIVEDVKEQLWNTLYEYPLKECNELNNYINESVKLCWLLLNHHPPFKLDYTSIRFDPKYHQRTERSNKQNDSIIQYVWPSLIDTSDNVCLSKAIVIT